MRASAKNTQGWVLISEHNEITFNTALQIVFLFRKVNDCVGKVFDSVTSKCYYIGVVVPLDWSCL